MHVPLHLLAAAAALGVVACSDSAKPPMAPPPAAPSFSTTSVTEPGTGPWARIIDGRAGQTATYRLYIPRTWNGDAIYYAHGVRANTPPDLREDAFSPVREILGARGFAVGYSSWSMNGTVFKDAAQRVHQVRGFLTAALPHPPSRSFLFGLSLGGGVALEILQMYPGQYDGALLVSGMLGGPRPEIDYHGNVHALFDVLYPGVWPGTLMATPPGARIPTLPEVTAAIQANPKPLFLIASLVETPLPYRPIGSPLDVSSTAFKDLVGSVYTALGMTSGTTGQDQFFDLTHHHPYFDNSRGYSLGSSPLLPISELEPMLAFANANVTRYTADPSAVNFMAQWFTPTGDLPAPVLTLHARYDPTNPILHETILYEKALAAGTTQNLLQRFYPLYGHANVISTALQVQGFLDMVDWVTTGVKPAS